MIADLRHPAMIHNYDLIRVTDSAEAVGDDQAGTVFHQPHPGILDLLFSSCIYRGSGLVQNQYFGSANTALAMTISCRWPWDRLAPACFKKV